MSASNARRRASRRRFMMRRLVALVIVVAIVGIGVKAVGSVLSDDEPVLGAEEPTGAVASTGDPTVPGSSRSRRVGSGVHGPAGHRTRRHRSAVRRQQGRGVHRRRQRCGHVRPVPADAARRDQHRRHRTQLQGVVRAGPPRLLRLAGRTRGEGPRGRSRHRGGDVRRQRLAGSGGRRTARSSCPIR